MPAKRKPPLTRTQKEELEEFALMAINLMASRDNERIDAFFEERAELLGHLAAWRDADGETLLMRAGREGLAKWALRLLPLSEARARDDNGETALSLAARSMPCDALGMAAIEAIGARSDKSEPQGLLKLNALQVACERGDEALPLARMAIAWCDPWAKRWGPGGESAALEMAMKTALSRKGDGLCAFMAQALRERADASPQRLSEHAAEALEGFCEHLRTVARTMRSFDSPDLIAEREERAIGAAAPALALASRSAAIEALAKTKPVAELARFSAFLTARIEERDLAQAVREARPRGAGEQEPRESRAPRL
jgi:hypothetical protein